MSFLLLCTPTPSNPDSLATEMSAPSSMTESLSKMRAGRLLRDHLANYLAATKGETHSAQLMASTLRRALLAGLQAHRRFGLPAKLPRYLLLANLSGEVVFLYSKFPELLRSILGSSGHPSYRAAATAALDRMVEFVDGDGGGEDNCYQSVLLVFVLPWQAGLGSFFWHATTLHPSSYEDGNMVFSSHNLEIIPGMRTVESGDFAVGGAEHGALASNVVAVSVDICEDPTGCDAGASPSKTADTLSCPTDSVHSTNEVRVLRETLNSLLAGRKKMQEELAEVKKDATERLAAVTTLERTNSATAISQALNSREVYQTKAAQSAAQAKEALASQLKAAAEIAEYKLRNRELEDELVAQKKSFSKQKRAVDSSAASQSGRIKEQEQELCNLRKRVVELETTKVEETNTRVALLLRQRDDLQLRVNSSGDLIASLNDVNEAQESKAKMMQLQLSELTSTLESERVAASGAAAAASKALATITEAYEGAHARVAESLALVATLRAQIEEVATEKATAATAAVSSTTGTCTETDTISTSTHSVAATQTDPLPTEFEDMSVLGASRNAYNSLLRLIELSQAPKVDYTPSFHGHWKGGVFRPASWPPPPHHGLGGHLR